MATSFDLHPGGNGRQAYLRVSLDHVRAANDIIVSYDLERDGWVIESPTKMSWEDEDPDSFEELLEEVAFIPAWSEAADRELARIDGPPDAYRFVDVPVISGVATLPDGRIVRSPAAVVRVPVMVEPAG